MIADFLDLEGQIRRRFREDSVTDILIAALLRVGGPDVAVIVPFEPPTGSDLDILVADPATGNAVQYRIQAKRLYSNPKDWRMGSYRELAHPHGTGKQAATLIRAAKRERIPTLPLYAFYHPATDCAASGQAISGIELASGNDVAWLVAQVVKRHPKRLPNKRVGFLKPLFFPFSTILCPPDGLDESSNRLFVEPTRSRQAVEDAISQRRAEVPLELLSRRFDRIPTILPDPNRTHRHASADSGRRAPGLPPLVRKAIEARTTRQVIRGRVFRPKIVLVSEER